MDLKGFYTGLKASIIATTCCSIPLALVLLFSTLGVGSMTAALKITTYKNYFIAFGIFFLGISLYLTIKRRSGGTCSINDIHSQKGFIILSIISYSILTYIVIYLLLPLISAWLFRY